MANQPSELNDVEHMVVSELARIDMAISAGDASELKATIHDLSTLVREGQLNANDLSWAHHGLGIGWHGLYHLRRSPHHGPDLSWDRPETGHVLSHFRRSCEFAFQADNLWREGRAWHFLGNELDDIGRNVEAIQCWTEALKMAPTPEIAGDLAVGLERYARVFCFPPLQALLLTRARQLHKLAPDTEVFRTARRNVEQAIDAVGFTLSRPPKMRRSRLLCPPKERRYRRWALEQTLFLNPVNDLGPFWAAARDALSVDCITPDNPKWNDLMGMMNQLVQEYVSARYQVYLGITQKENHFSDRWVVLPGVDQNGKRYGLGIEQLKGGIRSAFSLFDKIAVFLNEYLDLGHPAKRVSFRKVWFRDAKPGGDLLEPLTRERNIFLLALYYLSRDIHDSWEVPAEVAMNDPLAKAMYLLRQHTEHRFLYVLDDPTLKLNMTLEGGEATLTLTYGDLLRGAPLTLRLARAGLMYLMLAVHTKEHQTEQ